MIKMAEFTPHVGELLATVLRLGFDQDRVAAINGEVEVAKAFSELPFDHLRLTGCIPVGKHVMRAAAEHLTPVALELGGKSPAIIADDIPLHDIIDRLVFAKTLHAGQTCVAPDDVLVPRARLKPFLEAYKATFNRMQPSITGNSDDTSLINERNHQRLRHSLQVDAERLANL